jgi:hypothetical protein
MTITDQDVIVSYSGNDLTTQFNITQQIQDKTQIEVYLRDSDGVETLQVETTDFTFEAVPVPTYVTFGTAPVTGDRVVIKRVTPKTQVADYVPTGPFPAATHEAVLDKIVQMIQELKYGLDRAVRFPDVLTTLSFDPTLPEDTVGAPGGDRAIVINAAGDGFSLGPTTDEIDTAETSAIAAAASEAAALAAQSAAEAAQLAAEAAQLAAETAETNAETAETNAETAESNAAASAAAAADALVRSVGATLTPVGTTQTIDWDPDQIQVLDLGSASGDVTLTLNNPEEGRNYTLLVIQGATPRNIVWPAACLFPQGQDPLLSETDDSITKIEMVYAGTNYYCDWNSGYAT